MADFAAASASALRDTIMTLQPSPARVSAAARPIPLEPPVIKAVLPASLKSIRGSPAKNVKYDYDRRPNARQPALSVCRFDHTANTFTVAHLGAKSEIACRRIDVDWPSRRNRLTVVNLKTHRLASRRSSGCDIARCHLFRMCDKIAELFAAPGKAGGDRRLCGVVNINVGPVGHWLNPRNFARQCRTDDFFDGENGLSSGAID